MSQAASFLSDLVKMQEGKREQSESERKRGNEFYSLGDHEQAINCYTNAIRINPADPLNFSNRAMAYLR